MYTLLEEFEKLIGGRDPSHIFDARALELIEFEEIQSGTNPQLVVPTFACFNIKWESHLLMSMQ